MMGRGIMNSRRWMLVSAATAATLAVGIGTAVAWPLDRSSGSASADTSSRLRWPPPKLVHPIRIRIASPTHDLYLNPHADYILKMPPKPVRPGNDGGLWIHGGHNIVVIGGEFDFNGVVNTNPTVEKEGRVITLFDVTGVVHIEGIWAHGNGLIEGIQNYAPRAVVQVENCRFDHLNGKGVYHSDLFQFDVGRGLRIDRFTGSSNVQGFFLTDMRGHVYISRTNLTGDRGGQYLFWQGDARVPQTLHDVYISPAPGRSLGDSVWPSTSDPRPLWRARVRRGIVTWPRHVRISGGIKAGMPRGGAYVPRGVAGVDYLSPGYKRRAR
jgi:hypothetical protein